MKKYIHGYLSECYHIVSNNTIDSIDNQYIYFTKDKIIDELFLIFGLSKKQSKWYIKSWVYKQHTDFDFNIWWDKKPPTKFLPFSSVPLCRTIANELIQIQPLSPPTGIVHYMSIDLCNEENISANIVICNNDGILEYPSRILDTFIDEINNFVLIE